MQNSLKNALSIVAGVLLMFNVVAQPIATYAMTTHHSGNSISLNHVKTDGSDVQVSKGLPNAGNGTSVTVGHTDGGYTGIAIPNAGSGETVNPTHTGVGGDAGSTNDGNGGTSGEDDTTLNDGGNDTADGNGNGTVDDGNTGSTGGEPTSCQPFYTQYDYDNDGDVDYADADLLRKHLLGFYEGWNDDACPDSFDDDKVCDLNDSNTITTLDILLLTDIIIGDIDAGEVCDDNIDNNCNNQIDEGCSDTSSPILNTEATTKIACVVDGQLFDLDQLPEAGNFACGETVECGVWFKNMGDEPTEGFLGTVDILGGIVDHTKTSTTGNISCEQVGTTDAYTCDGFVPANSSEDLFVTIDMPTCACDYSESFDINSSIATTNDESMTNNTDTYTVTYSGPACDGTETTCTETALSPTTVDVDNGEFTITCSGDNVDTYNITVELDGQVVDQSGSQTSNQYTYNPSEEGEYTFTCIASGSDNTAICDAVVGTATDNNGGNDVCENDITSLTVQNYTNGQTVYQNAFNIEGNVLPGAASITVDGNAGTVSGTDWIGLVNLELGENVITIVAQPLDSDCDPFTTEITLFYEENPNTDTTACLDTVVTPATVDVDNGEFTVTCSGQNVDKYMVSVDLNGQQVANSGEIFPDANGDATWTYDPAQTGEYVFTCTAWGPYGDDFCPYDTGVAIDNGTPPPVCEEPITSLSIDSHQDNQQVNTNTITIEGTIEPGSSSVVVSVNGVDFDAIVTGTTYSVDLVLQGGSNDIVVTADPADGLCPEQSIAITLLVNPVNNGGTTCDLIDVNPDQVVLNGDDFDITCSGTNVSSFTFLITTPSGVVAVTQADAGNDDTETYTYEPTEAGLHFFTCQANGLLTTVTSPAQCSTLKGLVTTTNIPVCEEPITTLTIDSHLDNQTVNTNTVTIEGTVVPGSSSVEVSVNGTVYTAVVNGTTYSVDVTLTEGANEIIVTADPADALCAEESVTIDLEYTPDNNGETMCTETDVTDVVQLGNNFVVKCSGVNVDSYRVEVKKDDVIITTSPLLVDTDDNDMESWAYQADQTGEYEFTCYSRGQYSDPVCPSDTGVVVDNGTVSVCSDTEVNPDAVVLNNGVFDITCEGQNITQYMVTVALDGQTLGTSPVLNGNTWTYDPLQVGEYTFTCSGIGTDNQQYVCPGETTTVTYNNQQCVDEITSLTVTNYQSGDTVNDTAIELVGQVLPGAASVSIQLENGSVITAMVNGTTWTATVPVTQAVNSYTIIATPTDALCDTRQLTFVLQYENNNGGGNVCTDPVGTVAITNITNGDTFTTNTITVQTSVQNINNVDTVTINGVEATLVNGLYEATITLSQGSNTITAVATPKDADCMIETDVRTVSYTPNGQLCQAPVTLTVVTPSNNSSTRASSVTVKGTVSSNATEVTVNGEVVEIMSQGGFETNVSLVNGSNTITVAGANADPLCDEQQVLTVQRRSAITGGSSGRTSSITEYCGNNKVESLEQCDDGNTRSGDGCSASCQIEYQPVCGNGIVELAEQCDDNNNINGDGCNATCELEEIVIPERKEVVTVTRLRPAPLELRNVPVILPETGNLSRPSLRITSL